MGTIVKELASKSHRVRSLAQQFPLTRAKYLPGMQKGRYDISSALMSALCGRRLTTNPVPPCCLSPWGALSLTERSEPSAGNTNFQGQAAAAWC